MDIETALRRHLAECPDINIGPWVNNEGRMMITFNFPDKTSVEFVVVGDTAINWPIKPPAQRVAAEGFQDSKGMGDMGER